MLVILPPFVLAPFPLTTEGCLTVDIVTRLVMLLRPNSVLHLADSDLSLLSVHNIRTKSTEKAPMVVVQ